MCVNTFSAFEQKHGKSCSQSAAAIGIQHSSVYCHPCNGVATIPSKFCNGLSGGQTCNQALLPPPFFGGGGGAGD